MNKNVTIRDVNLEALSNENLYALLNLNLERMEVIMDNFMIIEAEFDKRELAHDCPFFPFYN